jgi:putative hydrolase of the HAD superfamily
MKLVFDFGGVVFHWQPTQLLQRVLPERATDQAQAAYWVGAIFQGYGGDWGDFDRGTVQPAALVQRIAQRTGLTAGEVQRVVDGVADELQPQPATVALLQRLHAAGRELHYLSNMPAPVAAQLQARHAFLGWFKGGVFSSHVGLNKPEPEIYALAAQRFGGAPGQLVFLDDHLPNVEAARAAGWQALHFSDAARAEAELQARGWMQPRSGGVGR